MYICFKTKLGPEKVAYYVINISIVISIKQTADKHSSIHFYLLSTFPSNHDHIDNHLHHPHQHLLFYIYDR